MVFSNYILFCRTKFASKMELLFHAAGLELCDDGIWMPIALLLGMYMAIPVDWFGLLNSIVECVYGYPCLLVLSTVVCCVCMVILSLSNSTVCWVCIGYVELSADTVCWACDMVIIELYQNKVMLLVKTPRG